MTSTKSQKPEPDPVNLAIGRKIRVLAGKAGISQYRMADAIGVRQPQVHERLEGRIAWRTHEITALAELLGCEVSDLMAAGAGT